MTPTSKGSMPPWRSRSGSRNSSGSRWERCHWRYRIRSDAVGPPREPGTQAEHAANAAGAPAAARVANGAIGKPAGWRRRHEPLSSATRRPLRLCSVDERAVRGLRVVTPAKHDALTADRKPATMTSALEPASTTILSRRRQPLRWYEDRLWDRLFINRFAKPGPSHA